LNLPGRGEGSARRDHARARTIIKVTNGPGLGIAIDEGKPAKHTSTLRWL
jgi:hypothetical protein